MAQSATYATKTLSTPKVVIDDVVVPIVPNSVTITVPGDAKVRFMSSGGGSGQIVAGINAETLIGKVKMEIPSTQQNADLVRKWKANMINGVFSTINIVELDGQFPYQQMQLTKDTDIHMKGDGNIPLEWEGMYVG